MKDLMGLMKQAQAMQQKMAEAQSKLDEAEVTGEAGAGLIAVTMTAKGDMKRVSIDKSLIDPEEPEILEDLIKAAHADARRRLDEAMEAAMKEATSGFGGMMPGFKMPF